jgi:UDP-glucose 6-dehydrogenase
MKQLFPDAYVYSPSIGTKEEANKGEVAFIAVPSPLKEIGQTLDTSIVEDCISWLTCPLIVVRSTVNPGDCDRWAKKYGKRIIHQPEYLGETPNHPLLNQKNNQFIIIGGDKKDTRKLINLYATVYNASIKIRQVTRLEAEVIKLSENRAIAFKVMECQELYDVCQKAGLDYYTIRDAVYGDDPRFNLWFSFVYPDKRGFNNSKCLRKDVPAFAMWAESLGITPDLTWALIRRSNHYETYGE